MILLASHLSSCSRLCLIYLVEIWLHGDFCMVLLASFKTKGFSSSFYPYLLLSWPSFWFMVVSSRSTQHHFSCLFLNFFLLFLLLVVYHPFSRSSMVRSNCFFPVFVNALIKSTGNACFKYWLGHLHASKQNFCPLRFVNLLPGFLFCSLFFFKWMHFFFLFRYIISTSFGN